MGFYRHSSMRSCNIITGKKGEGKTTRILKLSSETPSPLGFVTIHRGEEYFLKNLETGEESLLFSHTFPFSNRWKGWGVNFPLFDRVYDRMLSVDCGKVFLDECGRLEMEGLGYSNTIRLLFERNVDLYITLRSSFLDEFVKTFSIVDYFIIPIERWTDCD